jgi:hypothetical protein
MSSQRQQHTQVCLRTVCVSCAGSSLAHCCISLTHLRPQIETQPFRSGHTAATQLCGPPWLAAMQPSTHTHTHRQLTHPQLACGNIATRKPETHQPINPFPRANAVHVCKNAKRCCATLYADCILDAHKTNMRATLQQDAYAIHSTMRTQHALQLLAHIHYDSHLHHKMHSCTHKTRQSHSLGS